MVKSGQNKIEILDLSKAYDKVNRSILLQDCRKTLQREIVEMLQACLQQLKVSTKGDIMGNEAVRKLGLKEGAPLSTTLLLVYINDIYDFCPRKSNKEVITNQIGKAEMKLAADDVIFHTNNWINTQIFLDA